MKTKNKNLSTSGTHVSRTEQELITAVEEEKKNFELNE